LEGKARDFDAAYVATTPVGGKINLNAQQGITNGDEWNEKRGWVTPLDMRPGRSAAIVVWLTGLFVTRHYW
jgi:hypothetical protein